MGERKKTRQILVGKVKMGGGAPVTIQSMLNMPAEDFAASVEQAKRLEAAGCEIIRAAIPNLQSVPLIEHLKKAVSVPIVADIHFDYRLALEAVAAGVDKVRINPGNIGDEDRVRQVPVVVDPGLGNDTYGHTYPSLCSFLSIFIVHAISPKSPAAPAKESTTPAVTPGAR